MNRNNEENIGKQEKREIISWTNIIWVCAAVFATFACCILLFFLLFRIKVISTVIAKLISASASIIIGLLLTFIFNPVNLFFYRRIKVLIGKKTKFKEEKIEKISRALGITSTTILLIALIALLGIAIIPSVIQSVSHLVNAIPGYADVITKFIKNGSFGDSTLGKIAQNLVTGAADDLESWLENSVYSEFQTYLRQVTNGVISGLIYLVKAFMNFFIGIIVMDYLMAIQGILTGQTKKILYAAFAPGTANAIVNFGRKAADVFGGFISGKIIDSAIIAAITYVGCLILNIPDAVLVTLLVGVTNVIPFFGPFIGAVPSLLLVVVQSPWHAVTLLIFIVILQQIDGNIIGPKILGDSTGLSSFWIMVAILIGGGMFGIAGMILGVPCMAMLQYVVNNVVGSRLKKKKLPLDTKIYQNLNYIDPESRILVGKEEKRKD